MSVCVAAKVPVDAAPHGEIVWDPYGVPHVFAKNETGLFWGFGYAQAQAHGDLLLHLYGESRGRAAEYWGAKYAAMDRYLAANDVWERAEDWYKQQTPAMRANLDAFAAGINVYADGASGEAGRRSEGGAAGERRGRGGALGTGDGVPVHCADGEGDGAWGERSMEVGDDAPPRDVRAGRRLAQLDELERDPGGSNAWAVGAGEEQLDGHAMLLANPHLNWPPCVWDILRGNCS